MLAVKTVSDLTVDWHAVWQTAYDSDALYFRARCPTNGAAAILDKIFPGLEYPSEAVAEMLTIQIEPRRLWPAETFMIDRAGQVTYRAASGRNPAGGWNLYPGAVEPDRWSFVFRLPWNFFAGMVKPERPIRINVVHRWEIKGAGIAIWSSWTAPARLPFARLAYGYSAPAELAWLHCVGQ